MIWAQSVPLTISPRFDRLAGIPARKSVPRAQSVIGARTRAGVASTTISGCFSKLLRRLAWGQTLNVVPKIIAITRIDGKSTTSALVHHILKHAGRRPSFGW